MSRQPSLEDENLAIREDLAEMIEGTTIAEAEFEYRAGTVTDERRGKIETGALRLESANEAV
jgi:hypothetical protein